MFLGFFNEAEEATLIAPLTTDTHSPVTPDAAPVLSLLGAAGPIEGTSTGEPVMEGDVDAITATSPVTVTSTAHGLQTGQAVELLGTATRDGFWLVTVLSADTFSLTGAANGSAQASPAGSWRLAGVWKFELPTAALGSLGAGSMYTAVVSYAVAAVEKVRLFNFYIQ